jgi:hypothetical protein
VADLVCLILAGSNDMGFFRKKKKVNVSTVGGAVPTMLPPGFYEMAWEEQRTPNPGAMVYSWETLGLPQFSPVGAGRGIHTVIRSTQQVNAWYQSVPIAGMPSVPGQMIFQPLIRNMS